MSMGNLSFSVVFYNFFLKCFVVFFVEVINVIHYVYSKVSDFFKILSIELSSYILLKSVHGWYIERVLIF
jgi:hypothetical protein